MTRSMRSARALMIANVVSYAGFGLTGLFAPGWLAGQIDIQLSSATALADFRAVYGGLPIGAGLFMLAGIYRPTWLLPSIALAGVCALELALARAYSWIVSGTPSATIVAFMLVELLGAAWALGCYRALSAGPKPASASGLGGAALAR